MSVHSWQICAKKMCISKGISCRPIRQMQRPYYTKVLHEIHPNVTKVFEVFSVFFCCCYLFCFSNNFRCTSYKYFTFGYPKVHRPTYLIVISIDDLAPNIPQIRIWYGILTWTNQLTAIDYLNILASICRQQCILFYFFVTFGFFFSEIARLCSFIIDTFLFCI